MYERRASASTTDSGVSTIRTLASGPESSARTSSSSACSRSMAPKTLPPGIGTPAARVSTGRSALTTRCCTGKTRCMYQPRASGSASSRSVSAVGAQSTTTRSQSSLSACSRSSSSASTSSAPGMTVSSSAASGVHAGDVEHGEQVALDLRPGLLEAELGVDLLDEEVLGDLARLGPDGGAERLGQRVRAVGRQHQGAVALAGRERGRAGGDGRLADAALAGEQDDAHGDSPL